jgi:hypothetical protein
VGVRGGAGWAGKRRSFSVQHYSLHIQKTRGMKAPMATKIGNMAEESSLSYGSRARGPLGLRFFPVTSRNSSPATPSSSVSIGRGGK